MTKKEILAMKAGRELDDLVADAVGLPKPHFDMNAGCVKPRYSTDILAAWQVVEKMEESGWLWETRKYPCVPPYEFEFYKFKEGTHYRSGVCGFIPEAICRAALLVQKDGHAGSAAR